MRVVSLQRRGLAAPVAVRQQVLSASARRRNTDMLVLLGSGLTGTLIGVLYAADKQQAAGIVTMVTGLMGTVYGAVRLLEDWDTEEPGDEGAPREDA